MERREFIKKTTVAGLVLCTCSIGLGSCAAITGNSITPDAPRSSYTINKNTVTIDISKIPEFEKKGTAVKIEHNIPESDPLKIIVAYNNEGQYLAFDNRCTHGGREIEYIPNKHKFQCISFGHSSFNMNGDVLSGPAEYPLKKYEINKINGKLKIII